MAICYDVIIMCTTNLATKYNERLPGMIVLLVLKDNSGQFFSLKYVYRRHFVEILSGMALKSSHLCQSYKKFRDFSRLRDGSPASGAYELPCRVILSKMTLSTMVHIFTKIKQLSSEISCISPVENVLKSHTVRCG